MKVNIINNSYINKNEIEITDSQFLSFSQIDYFLDRADGYPPRSYDWWFNEEKYPYMSDDFYEVDSDFLIHKATGEIYQKFITGWDNQKVVKVES